MCDNRRVFHFYQNTALIIYCEDTLTYKEAFFSDVAEVHYFSANDLTATELKSNFQQEADALFVRSTTKVDKTLVADASKLKFVATATAGTDHLDLAYLRSKGIETYAATGCNAIAVAEYVIAGLLWLSATKGLSLVGKTLGIVGAGNVGTALAERIVGLGMHVQLCDPPRQQLGDPRHFVTLENILECDVISLHVPFITSGCHPTYHMFDEQVLHQLSSEQVLVNACRGEVVDNHALHKRLQNGAGLHTIFDVWENEPDINFALAQLTDIATQHIAGHSLEGKARGTDMVYNRAAAHFGWPKKSMWDFLPTPPKNTVNMTIPSLCEGMAEGLHAIISNVYDIAADSEHVKQQVNNARQFRYSRKNYGIRREFASAQVCTGNSAQLKALFDLGFNVKN